MRADRFTLKSQEALEMAQNTAASRGNPQVDTEHLLHAIVSDPEGITSEVLKKLGVDPQRIQVDIESALEKLPSQSGAVADRYFSSGLRSVLEAAFKEMEQLKDEYVSVEHMLISLAEISGTGAHRILSKQGVTKDRIYSVLTDIRGTQRVTDQNPEEKYQA